MMYNKNKWEGLVIALWSSGMLLPWRPPAAADTCHSRVTWSQYKAATPSMQNDMYYSCRHVSLGAPPTRTGVTLLHTLFALYIYHRCPASPPPSRNDISTIWNSPVFPYYHVYGADMLVVYQDDYYQFSMCMLDICWNSGSSWHDALTAGCMSPFDPCIWDRLWSDCLPLAWHLDSCCVTQSWQHARVTSEDLTAFHCTLNNTPLGIKLNWGHCWLNTGQCWPVIGP